MAEKQRSDLAALLGAAPPADIKNLPAAERRHLAELVADALERQEAAVEEAEESLLRHVPRALRPAVRSFLKGGR